MSPDRPISAKIHACRSHC